MTNIKKALVDILEINDSSIDGVAMYMKYRDTTMVEKIWGIGYIKNFGMHNYADVSFDESQEFTNSLERVRELYGEEKQYSELSEEKQVAFRLMLY